MWFWLIVIAIILIVVAYIAISLQPQKVATGGGLDSFLSDAESVASDESHGAAAFAEEAKKYGRIYTDEDGPGRQVMVLYATEYGFSEEVARKFFDKIVESAGDSKLQPRLVNMRDALTFVDLGREQVVLNVCSTTGDGVPPNDAREFFEWVNGGESGRFAHLQVATLALGDSSYPYYCRAARALHARYLELNATGLVDRVDVDQEDWPVIDKWMDAVIKQLHALPIEMRQDYITERPDVGMSRTEKHNRSKPYMAKILVKRPLTAPLSPEQRAKKNYDEDKEVVHFEIELGEDSELSYTSGDAIGIYPSNNPPEVAACLKALAGGKDSGRIKAINVVLPRGAYEKTQKPERNTLEDALKFYYDLKHAKPELVVFLQKALEKQANGDAAFAQKERDELAKLLAGGASAKENDVLRAYLYDREVADVLEHFAAPYLYANEPAAAIPQVLANMRMLQPRYYSIASSPVMDSRRAAVTAAVVRYSTLSKDRTGVCTTFLSDRSDIGVQVPVFISKNHDFRLPADSSRGIVMVGPGTGIAPFRGFLQERVLANATGKNIFYFGCRKRDLDYLYKDELEAWEKDGKVQLRTAFSREQKEKVYVQHRLLEDAATVWNMLEDGAHFYVCGDAGRMANDVHNALLSIIQSQGARDEAQAKEYMHQLEAQKRYQRDVWVT